MEVGSTRSWDELLPDALGLIFKNLPLQELLTVVPTVCKSWGKAVMGPYCWQEIDIEEWSNRSEPGSVERMLRMLITRSSGSIHKLCVSGLQNELVFSLIAENARSLRILRLPRSNMSDSIVEKIASSLSMITFLDLSYCYKIGARSLEAIGEHCKQLEGFRRNMHPLITEDKLSQDDEAHAIATTMPNLKHLEAAYLHINTIGALEIIRSCPNLEYLDLRGCWQVKLDEEYLKDKFPNLKVLGPYVVDQYERNNDDYEDWSDFSDSLYDYESSDDDDNRFGELEFRFYQQSDEDATYGWPQSP